MSHEKLIKLIQAAIQSLKNWQLFTSQISSPYFLGGRDLITLYLVVAEQVAKLNDVPSTEGLITALYERICQTQELDNAEWQYLYNLIVSSPSIQLTEAEVAKWSGDYIINLKHSQLIDEVADLPPEELRSRLAEYTADLAKAEGSTQFTEDDFDPFSDEQISLRSKVVNFTRTGVSFIDKYIGGFSGREMYSYIGPSGAGKSAMGVQIAVSYAKKMSIRYRESLRKKPLGKVFYVTTEDGMVKITDRMVSCLAKVPLAKLSGKDPTPKTTAVAMSERDVDICNEWFGGVMSGEAEREHNAQKLIRQTIRIIDLTNPKIRGIAEDPVDVVRLVVNKILETDKQEGRNTYCALIVIDHTADIIFDKLSRDKSKNSNLWLATQNVPSQVRDTLAFAFNCPVWVIHQANGDGNRKKSHQTLDHTNAMGSGSWAMHFTSAFNISHIDEATSMAILTCTKARENKKLPPTYLKLIGDVGTLVEQGNAVLVDNSDEKKNRKTKTSEDTYTGTRRYRKKKEEPLVADT